MLFIIMNFQYFVSVLTTVIYL